MSKDPFDTSLAQDLNEEPQFHLRDFVYKYLTYWKWFILSITVALILGYIFLKFQTPIFSIHSSILVKDQQKGLGEESDMMKQMDIFSSNKVVDNEIQILTSYTLMKEVVDSLKLNITYYRKGYFREIEMYRQSPVKLELISETGLTYKTPLVVNIINKQSALVNGQTVFFNKSTNTPYGFIKLTYTRPDFDLKELIINIATVKSVTENLNKELQVEPSTKMSTVLIMTIENAVPEKGEDILNQLIYAYNSAGLTDKNLSASNTLEFINERLRIISDELGSAEKRVEDYKSREGITDIDAATQIFLENIQTNDGQLNQVKLQQNVLADIEKHVSSPDNDHGTIPATLMGMDDQPLLDLITQLSTLELQRQSTARVVKPGNPILQTLDEQIATLKRNIYDNVQTLKRSLNISRQQLEKQASSMYELLKKAPAKERGLIDISRQESIKNDLYTFLLKNREETELSYASTVSDTRTVDKAISKDVPIRPKKIIIMTVFGLLGLIIPFSVIYLLDSWNDKIKDRKDVEKETNTPILGEISISDSENVLVFETGRSAISEQIRSLRTNMAFLSPGKKLQVIMLTSSISGEGKSFISLNLGASLAIINKRVIVIELDLRQPKLMNKLKVEHKTGLTNYLIGHAELDNIIHPVPGYNNYDIITSGLIPPNPVELLLDGRTDELFSILRSRYDYIIVDAPPVGLVTDALVIEKYTDATFYVVRHEYTPKARLKYIDALYNENRFKNFNLIINGIQLKGKYGYGYGFDYGSYGTSEKKAK
jgi:tyrosine-protein kinase Etk/Wzc